jgi:hypothetical protein
MAHFVKRYGLLRGRISGDRCREDVRRLVRPTIDLADHTPHSVFAPLVVDLDADSTTDQKSGSGAELLHELGEAHAQSLVQFAWETGNEKALAELEEQACKGLRFRVSSTGGLEIPAADLWTLICLLFLRDQAAGKTAKCVNPGCPAPYFLKNRKTQKICEAGDCVTWAQRRYARKWWRENRGNDPKKARGK